MALGLCNLGKNPQSLKPVLQVRQRPGSFSLRDFHNAVARLALSAGSSADRVDGASAASALQQLVCVVAQDAACAAAATAAGPEGGKSVLYLTDREDCGLPDDFRPCLEVGG